jgi:translation elongation factor EF-Ts
MQSHDMGLVDEIRRRLDATYSEALAGLEESQGDLLKALAIIEEKRKSGAAAQADLIEQIFRLAEEGVKALRVRVGRRFVKEVPVGMGAFGSLLAAFLVGFVGEISLEAVRGEQEQA